MAGVRHWRLLLAILLCLGWCGRAGYGQTEPATAAHQPPRHILVLNSYHQGYPFTDREMAGIKAVTGERLDIELHVAYMDAKRNCSPEYLAELARLYKIAYANCQLAAILATDNDALDFVCRYRSELFPSVPIIFCGINDFTPRLLVGQEAISGVAEASDYRSTILLGLNLFRSARRVVVLTDNTTTGRSHITALHRDLEAGDLRADVAVWSLGEMTFTELEARLRKLDTSSLLLVLQHYVDRNGTTYSTEEGLHRILAASGAPVFVVNEMRITDGVVGGHVVNGFEQGRAAAEMLLRVLAGEDLSRLPVTAGSANRYMFDYNGLRRWGIGTGALPAKSVILNQPTTFWHVHRNLGVGLVTLIVWLVLIAATLALIIRHRARRETELREREAFFQGIIEKLPVPLVVIDHNTILMLNRTFTELFGWTLAELPDMQHWLATAAPGVVRPPSLRDTWDRDREALLAGNTVKRTLSIAARDGTQRTVAFIALAIDGHRMVGLFDDITAQRRMEDSLRESEEKYRTLFETMAQGIVYQDADGHITAANPAATRLLGLAPEQLRSRAASDPRWQTIREDLSPMPSEEYPSMISLRTGRPVHNVVMGILHPEEKRHRWVVVNSTPVFHDDQETAGEVYVTLTDITEAKGAARKLELLLGELEQKNREMEMILYVTSHDLRSPLVNLEGFGSMLETACNTLRDILADASVPEAVRDRARMWTDERIPKSVKFILGSTRKMNSLVNGLLQVSRTGQAQLHREQLDMNALLGAVVHTMTYQIQEVQAQVELNPVPACHGDSEQINQIFANLIGNALKYRTPGQPPRITISGEVKEGEAIYCVSDHGVGIAPQHQHRIWDLFQRLSPDDTIPGEGIGLTLVKRIVERHHGRCWLESTPGEGSRFYVALPTSPEPAAT